MSLGRRLQRLERSSVTTKTGRRDDVTEEEISRLADVLWAPQRKGTPRSLRMPEHRGGCSNGQPSDEEILIAAAALYELRSGRRVPDFISSRLHPTAQRDAAQEREQRPQPQSNGWTMMGTKHRRELIAEALRAHKARKPQSDEQLWLWIERVLGFSIAWRAVCPEHQAPFQFLADAFFRRVTGAVLHGPRGGGKTRSLSILHLANGHFDPGFQTSHVAAVQRQANLCYSYVREYLRDPDLGSGLVREPLMTETRCEAMAGAWRSSLDRSGPRRVRTPSEPSSTNST